MGTFFSAQAAAKQMVARNTGGSIVMISSVTSHCAIPSQKLSMYGASKGAIRILARHLAVELAPHGVRVNSLSPGYTATDMTNKLRIQRPDLLEIFEKFAPVGRMGRKSDLAGAVAYLLSNSASYTTGTDIRVDGALAAGRP